MSLCFPTNKQQAEAVMAAWQAAGFVVESLASTNKLAATTAGRWLKKAHQILGIKKGTLAPALIPGALQLLKTTVQYDAAGNVLQEWRRLVPEAKTLEEIADSLCEMVKGKAPKLPPGPKPEPNQLMLEIPLYDVHFGKYCDAHETDTNYDIKIAKQLVVGSVQHICASAGPVNETLIVIGGDFFHSDTRHNRTEMSGNPLDVDTRQHKVWKYATDALQESIMVAAANSQTVRLLVIPGNHDWESSFHLSRLLAAYYRNEKRIKVEDSPKSRRYIRWGVVLLGFAHGNLIKMGDLATLMAQEKPADWSQSQFRVWHLGHIHKKKSLRHAAVDGVHGVEVEHLESIAGTDAWHHENGFVGMPRRAEGFVWHAKQGLRARLYVNAGELTD